MKKLLLLSIFFIFACSSDDNSQASSSEFKYWFKITIGDETFEIEGDINDYVYTIDNQCQVGSSLPDWVAILSINDPTENNYVSGGNIRLVLTFQPIVGLTSAYIDINQALNPYLNSYFLNSGVVTEFGTGGTYFDNDFYSEPFLNSQTPLEKNTIEFEISNLGMPYEITADSITGGEMFTGSHTGTWYFKDSNYQYSIPFDVSIEFKAYRFD